MNYYEHHLGDYLKDTAHLSIAEDGIYHRLIDLYYLHEKPLPNDVEKICKLIRISKKKEKELVRSVLEEFFKFDKNEFRHIRCDLEIAKAKAKSTSARNSANARWQAEHAASSDDKIVSIQQCGTDADALRLHQERTCEDNATGMLPDTTNHKPKKVKSVSSLALLTSRGISQDLAMQWLKIRKGKRMELTEIALQRTIKEAEKVGYTLEAVIILCCENSWAGFKAEYLANAGIAKASGKPWFLSWSGIQEKGRELSIFQNGTDDSFRMQVLKASGLTKDEYRKGCSDFNHKDAAMNQTLKWLADDG